MLKSLFPWKHHKTKAMAAQQTMNVAVPEDQPVDQPLLPCHVCGRTFLPTPLRKHERICEKSASKKRKPFDSLRQRVEGTDLADFHQKTYLKKPEPIPVPDPKKNRQSNWKEKHLELVNTIRAAKGVPTAGISPTRIKATTSLMAGNERCPSCDRQFGPKAYDRHVEWCKEKKAQQRIHHSPATVLLAKERLEARTKYTPPLNKAKKIAVREKYSNQNTSVSTETLTSVKSVSPLSRGPSVRKPRSEVNLGRVSDKTTAQEDRDKARMEKSMNHGDKLKRQESMTERHTPVIASKADPTKNSQKKKVTPYMKINDSHINQVDGISVASLKFDYANKKMVTWKDTVEHSSEEKLDQSLKKNCPKIKNSDSNSNSAQSMNAAALPETEKINCAKILSSSDVLHKDSTKVSIPKLALNSKIITNRHKEDHTNDTMDELELSSNRTKIVSLKSKLPSLTKKINRHKEIEKCEEDSIELNAKKRELIPVKSPLPLPARKKTIAKKINKSRKQFVEELEDDTESCPTPSVAESETISPVLLKAKPSLSEENHITLNKVGATNQKSDFVRKKTTHLLKSSFTKKLNTEKFPKKGEKEKTDIDVTPKQLKQINSPTFLKTDNTSVLYKSDHIESSDTISEEKLQAKIGRQTLDSLTDADKQDIIVTTKWSENSISSNCSTINSEETYLINRSSTDEFNSSQNFGNNKESSTSLTLTYSTSNLTDSVDEKTPIRKNLIIFEKSGGKMVSFESGSKHLDAIIDSQQSLTANSSELDVRKCAKSCKSVTEAFEKLSLESTENITPRSISQDDTKSENTFVQEESKTGADETCQNLVNNEPASQPSTMFDSFRNTHKEFTNWFDEYMKKNVGDNEEECLDDEVEYPPEKEIVLKTAEYEIPPEKSIDKPVENIEANTKSENLVLLFKSTTSLDLTKESTDYTNTKMNEYKLNIENRISEETIDTSCDLDSFDLDCDKPSNFSLKKSVSDIDVTTTSSYLGLSGKNTLISIYYNKNKENSDIESINETKRTRTKSLPNIYLVDCTVICDTGDESITDSGVKEAKNDSPEKTVRKVPMKQENKHLINKYDVLDERENLRRKILALAAEEFIEECRELDSLKNEDGVNADATQCLFPEEEYTVPKKKRKVESRAGNEADFKVTKFSDVHFNLGRFKAMTLANKSRHFDENAMGDFLKKKDPPKSSNGTKNKSSTKKNDSVEKKSAKSNVSSARTSVSTDCSPRLVTILDKVLNASSGNNKENSKALIVVTLSDCLKLVELDGKKLPKIKKQLEKIKKAHGGKYDNVKLPPIESKGREDKEIQAGFEEEGSAYLPKIMDKFIRRGVLKKCTTDVKAGVKDVYLEYDGDSNSFTYDPFESAQRQFMELLDCDDFKSIVPTSTPAKHTPRPHTTSAATPTKQRSPATKKKIKSAEPALTKVNKNNNRASVIDPPITFKDSLDSVVDDFELMENLIKEQFIDDNRNMNGSFYLHLKPGKESLTLSDILDNRKYSDEISIDPRLINENDNLSIPEHFKMDDFSPTSTIDTDITIQNDIDHYSVQYDKKIAALEPKPEKKSTEKKPVVKRSTSLVGRIKTDESPLRATSKKLTSKSKLTSRSVSSVATSKAASGEKKKGLTSLKKSTALFDPVPKPPSLKNKNDVDQYFSEKQQRNLGVERSSPEKELSDTIEEALKPDELFAVDDEMYEEYKKYEELYLKEKAQTSSKKKQKPKLIDINFGILTASEEDDQSAFNNKIANDSAYGSLTRKTPKHRSRATKLTPLEQKQADSSSSSGSERCPNSPAAVSQQCDQRLSKFCHECGNRYPLSTAKFCVECGVKRLVL